MEQESILRIIENNPGILQSEIRNNLIKIGDMNSLSDKLRSLRNKKLIRRERFKTTFKWFPTR
jgi:predicted transcriptional regulator